MLKNVASQTVEFFVFDYSTGAAKTGDAANITMYVSKDDGTLTALTDTSAAEISSTNAPGWYRCDVSQTESNANKLLFTGKSSTSNVAVVGRVIYTRPQYAADMVIDSSGRLDVSKVSGTAQTAGDLAALVTTVDTVVDAVKVKTDQLTFTKTNEIDANVQSINGVTITGNGGTGTEFGV